MSVSGVAWAAHYTEAPEFVDMVASGALPPVDDRLPENPVVLTPTDSIGIYGGTMRRVDNDSIGWLNQIMRVEPLAKFNRDLNGLRPNVLQSWDWNADSTEITLNFRKGIRWSDGVPLTADDFMYWWNDMVLDPDVSLSAPGGTVFEGELMKVARIDEFTVKLTFPEPNPLFLELSTRGSYNSALWLVPAHYMKTLDPKYSDATDDVNLMVAYNFATRIQQVDMPTLGAWVVTRFVPGQRIVATRNPYYWKVDTQGQQLPYITTIDSEIGGAGTRDLVLLNALAGKIDFQAREFNLKDVGLLLENQEAGNYTVKMWQRGDFAWPWLMPIYDNNDAGLVDLYYQQPFREALSVAINRDRLNEVVAFGLATPRQFALSPESAEFQTPEGKEFYEEWANSFIDYSPAKANALLDSIGVLDIDGDGFRERPDGTKLQIIVDMPSTDQQSIAVMDLIKEDWDTVGILTELNPVDNGTMSVRVESGEMQMRAWPSAAGWGLISAPTVWAPIEDVEWSMGGRSISRYYQTGGEKGTPPRPGSMLEQLQQAYAKIVVISDPDERNKALIEAYRIYIDNGPITIGTIGEHPSPIVVSNRLRNVQDTGLLGSWDLGFPGTSDPEQFYFVE